MVHQIVNYFVSNNYLSDCQFAFRNRLSTADAVHKIVDFIYTAFYHGPSVVGAFLDLAKAFDNINRGILYKKLDYYGVKGTELKWFKSYFSERKQIVRYNNEMSESLRTSYGVAQGSLLGPILFIIYVNGLVNCSDSLNFSMYADDSCVFLTDTNLNENLNKMNTELGNISKWMKATCLTLNAEKK